MNRREKQMNETNLKIIFGIKIKSYRTNLGLSLQELSKNTGIAVSYLSEIESGKKYPKPGKLFRLAEALEVEYDTLVSTRVAKNLDPFAALINSDLVKKFPFHLFGISAADILGLFKNNPDNAQAFLQTFLQISRAYDMSLENFLFAALRTFVSQHKNYFSELEKRAKHYSKELKIEEEIPSYTRLKNTLEREYSYTIEDTVLNQHPGLGGLRSVLKAKGVLSINGNLASSQKSFILAREIGFLELDYKERPVTSSWIKIQSFTQLVNNFKASYFGGALLLPKDMLISDLQKMMKWTTWDDVQFSAMLERYRATPEMLLYRVSQLLPGVFGLSNIFYFRFANADDRQAILLTKELNMTDTLITYGLGVNEHHCRRLLPLRLLKRLHMGKVHLAAGAQRVEFVKSGTKFILLSMARPLSLSKNRGSAIVIGIKIDNDSRSQMKFINDPGIVEEKVSESCERCPLTDCSERVVEASLITRSTHLEKRETALKQFMED